LSRSLVKVEAAKINPIVAFQSANELHPAAATQFGGRPLQEQFRVEERLTIQVEEWQTRLGGPPPALKPGFDNPSDNSRGNRLIFEIPNIVAAVAERRAQQLAGVGGD
jgi:hypothetical protein